jgi:TolB-like protein
MSLFAELKRRNVVRVGVAYLISAWIIAQVADIVLDGIKAPDWVMQALFLMMGLGFIAALIISWAYEITPEGIKKERDVVRDDSITHVTAKKLNIITLLGVIIVIIMFLWQQFMAEPNSNQSNVDITASSQTAIIPTAIESDSALQNGNQNKQSQIQDNLKAKLGENSIAVLPFSNRSNKDDDLYFTDGIHDDILTSLAKIKAMKVTSRTSVMKFRGTNKTIPEIGHELGVTTILEGGVQRAGKRIRINAQLIDVATDEHLWAETFDREMTIDNLFDIQSEITKHIVKAVKGQLSPDEAKVLNHKMTKSLAAWEAYSQARTLMDSSGYNAEKYLAALPLAERAATLDPQFLLAQLMLSNLHGYIFWLNVDPTDARIKLMREALDKAVKLAPNSAEVLAAEGEYAYRIKQDFRAALGYQQRALALEPENANFLSAIATIQRRLGLWDEAVANYLLAEKIAPDNQDNIVTAADTIEMTGDAQRLRVFLAEVRTRFPNDSNLGATATKLAIWDEGNLDKALRLFKNVKPVGGRTYLLTALDLAWYQRDKSILQNALDRPALINYLKRFGANLELQQALAYHIYGNSQQATMQLHKVVNKINNLKTSKRDLINALHLSTLATAKALLGESDEAIALAHQALNTFSTKIDKTDGPLVDVAVGYALALAGERDEALVMIKTLLDIPNGYKRWQLYLDPRWDFFRDDERFNKLIKPLNFDDSPYAKKRAKNKKQADKS